MIPEEDVTSSANTFTKLMGNEQRKQTLTNIMQNAVNGRQPSAAKRFSEPAAVNGNYSNPWDEGKRASVTVMEGAGRKPSANKPSLLANRVQLGRGLSCKLNTQKTLLYSF